MAWACVRARCRALAAAFGVGGVGVFEAPIDLAGFIGAGLGGDVQNACGGFCRGADGPALLGDEGMAGTLGDGQLVELMGLSMGATDCCSLSIVSLGTPAERSASMIALEAFDAEA